MVYELTTWKGVHRRTYGPSGRELSDVEKGSRNLADMQNGKPPRYPSKSK
jgi:hypothetical protein